MKILIITQKVDREDPILGFFHNWLEKLSERFEIIHVICLEKGAFSLPKNVEVFSLGKEKKENKIKYILKFFHLSFFSFLNYDTVFVHMNQEYVLLGGVFWKIAGKKIFMWRNHPKGSFLTRIAVWLSDKVFCTSKDSYTARFKKTQIMPVGIDTDKFIKFESLKVNKVKNSILFLGRISPIKRPDLLIQALDVLNKKNIDFNCDFYGDALPKDQNYYDSLKIRVKELGLESRVNFYKSVPNYETPKIYNEHEIFVNLTPSGSFDKTILEAAACGCIPVIANKSLSGEIDDGMIIDEEKPSDVAEIIGFWLGVSEEERSQTREKLQKYVSEKHSLSTLVDKLLVHLNSAKNDK